MSRAKELMAGVLKEVGASEATIKEFTDAYDNDMNEALNAKKEEAVNQFREEQASKLPSVQDLASKHNVRNK